MLNFEYHNPTRIVFGKNQLNQLDKLTPKNKRILIVYGGGSVKKFGTLDVVKKELAKSGRTLFEFDGVEPNPQYSTLMKAVKVVRDEKIDFIIALGGGSVMDGVKFISAAALSSEYFGKEEEILRNGFSGAGISKIVPFGTVVTLPATGSEMNCGAVISKEHEKLVLINPLLFPVFSVLDPELTFTLPQTQITNGIVDTFVHTLEQYVTYDVVSRFQDRTSEGILKTLVEIGETTIKEPKNYDVRADFMWCATMALNGVIGAGVPADWTTHMIGHELTALFGLDHAKSLAIIQPAVWRIRKKQKMAKLIQYGERVWDIKSGSDDERADKAIQKTEEFFRTLGMKTKLNEYGIKESDFDKIINALQSHGMTKLSETGDLDLNIVRQILKQAL